MERLPLVVAAVVVRAAMRLVDLGDQVAAVLAVGQPIPVLEATQRP